MALNNYFQITKKRPQPKLWLCKPNYSRIERVKEISNINGSFKYNNINQLTFTIPTEVFNEENHEQQRNDLLDTVRNKYVIEFQYVNFKDYFVIDEVKKISSDNDKIEIVANSVVTELNKKSVNEIKLLASTIEQIMDLTLSSYAPLWTLDYVDPKIANVKREIEMQQSTVTGVVDQINTLFDSVVVFNSVNRTISFYHKDNAGVNRGLRVRENSYLKSFEDSLVSTDVITRLYPVGKEGLSINSVNPAGTDYIEDFSYFMKPFQRDENRNVIQHSNYMSDELCHALLDYQELYESKIDEGKDITERYSNMLKEWTAQDLKLRELEAIKTQLEDRVELLKPKNEYSEYGNIGSYLNLPLAKSSYYLIMIKNYGSLARVKVKGTIQDVKANDWTYIKVDTDDFMDATKSKDYAIVPIEIVSANASLDITVTRSSQADYEDMEIKDLEEKYNYVKYRELYASQFSIVNALNKKLKDIEQEKVNLIDQLRPEKYLTPKLYNERELYVMSGVWQEENHTVAQELYDDAVKQLGQKNNSSRSVTIGLVNFTQSLEHEEDWDKLVAGEILVFSNKVFDEKLKAYITDLNISFDDNQVQVTISDVFDYKDLSQRLSETLATATSSASQINFQKEQIRNAKNDINRILEIVNGKIDTRKQIITAGGETIELNSKGIMNMEVGNREAYIIQNNGVISATRDNGNSHVVLADTKGLNAESLKGSMVLNNDTRIRNEDGSIYIDDEGIFVTKDKFNIIDNNGLDALEQIRKEQQDKIEELTKVYDQKINQLVDESAGVEKTIIETTNYITEAFKDSFITDFEQRKIEEHLAQLDKENKEYENQIEMALNHPYILPEDYIALSEAYTTYQGMYETLIDSITESISDRKITEKESQLVNESIIAFREEIKDILLLVQQVLETTRNTQIDSKVQKVVDYSTRIQEDLQDEMADLEKSINTINESVNYAITDGIFTAAEIETIKNNLLVMSSENRDIANRHNSIVANPNLPYANSESLKSVYTIYNDKFNELVNHINTMMEDKQADEQEILTYQALFNELSEKKKDYLTVYSDAVLTIAKAYSEDAKSQALGALDSFKTEYNNDLLDLQQSISDYKEDIKQSFSDGIITSTEKGRLKTHQEIIAREKQDLDKNYTDLYNNPLLIQANKDDLNNTKTAFNSAFDNLNKKINEVIGNGSITELENAQTIQALTEYDTAFTNYSNAIQKAINSLSKSVADKTASDKVNAFSSVISSIQGDISNIQKQVDGAIDTWYYNYDPTLSNLPASQWTTVELKNAHVGDFFLNNKTGNAYRFTLNGSTYAWTLLTDQAIADALRNASKAQDAADNKRRVFVNTPTAPYDVGDMWVQGTSGDIMVCTVAKLSNQVYSASDWQKASKYTDDTVAKQALSIANSTKQNFETFSVEVVQDFNDGIITEAEMTRLKTHLDIIQKDYTDLTTNVTDLKKVAELNSTLKSTLSSAESRYKADYNILKDSLESYISDKQITQLEKDNTATYLNNYTTALSDLTLAIQKCLNSISETMAINKAKEAVDALEFGGRNLLLDSKTYNLWTNNSTTVPIVQGKSTDGNNTIQRVVNASTTNNSLSTYSNHYYKVTRTGNYIEQVKVKPSGTMNLRLGSTGVYISCSANEWTTLTRLLNYTSIPSTDPRFGALYSNHDFDTSNPVIEFKEAKIEKGNKPTDYTLAPEDTDKLIQGVQKETSDITKAITNYEGTIGTSFKDNIITTSEAKGLAQQKMMLEKEKDDLTAKYNEIYNNSLLTGTFKTNLATAISQYGTSHSALLSSIDVAISDNKTTALEFSTVSQKFNDYKTKLSTLTTRFEQAIDSLSTTKANNAASQYSATINEINGKYDTIKAQSDASINSYFYPHTPTLSNAPANTWTDNTTKDIHVGDYFLDTSTGKYYTFTKVSTTYSWTQGANTAIQTALTNASKAQGTADKKKTVFTTQPVTPYDVGDMWTQGSGGDLYVCKVARASGSYVASDWEKATKYTDDTKANSAYSLAEKATTDLSKFWDSTNGIFKDGIIDSSELPRLKSHLDTLNNDKLNLGENVTDLNKNANLDTAMKNTLSSLQTTYNNAHKALYDTLNNAVSDKKVTDSEITDVSNKFSAYGTALSNLTTHIQKCYSNIADNIAKGRSTEAVDGLEIGTRNLLLDSGKEINANTYLINRYKLTEDWTTEKYTITVWGTVNSDTQKFGVWADNGSFQVAYLTPNATRDVWTATFNGRISTSTQVYPKRTLSLYNFPNDTTGVSNVKKIKLEKGSKATGWTPAPEDIDAQFATLTQETGELKTAVQGLQGTINSGFADGIVTEAEAKAINQSKLQLEKEKKDFDGQYVGIYGSPDLTDESIKAELKTAKDNYDSSHSSLMSAITEAIKDGKATPQESALVTSRFADYSNKIGILSEKLTLAYDRLSLVRAEKIRVGGKNILNNSDFSLGSKNWGAYGGTVSYEIVDGYSVAKLTNATHGGIYHSSHINLMEPEIYTISFKAKSIGATSRVNIGLLNQSAGHSNIIDISNTWKNYSYVFTLPANTTASTTFHIYSTVSSQQGFYITQVQLEKGNKATDWTPSLADVNDNIAEKTPKKEIIATINASGENVTIDGNKININGNATFSNTYQDVNGIKAGTTQVNPNAFKNYGFTAISGGKIEADSMTLKTVNIVRPDGAIQVQNGVSQGEMVVTGCTPPFTSTASAGFGMGVWQNGEWYATTRSKIGTDFARIDAYYFNHDFRFLLIPFAIRVVNTGVYVRIEEFGNSSSSSFSITKLYTTASYGGGATKYDSFTIDLGTPTFKRRQFYLYMKPNGEGSADDLAYARFLPMKLKG